MKTVVTEILEKRTKEFDVMKFVKWLDENRYLLLNLERGQISSAFDEGRENYNEDSQDTIDADEYFKDTYEN